MDGSEFGTVSMVDSIDTEIRAADANRRHCGTDQQEQESAQLTSSSDSLDFYNVTSLMSIYTPSQHHIL